jgi:Cu-Zn family superoxide dismutase
MKLQIHLVVALLVCFLLVSAAAFSGTATAVLNGTEKGSSISGAVTFQDTENGLLIRAEFHNLPPGKHGFHIHEFGLITNGGKNAGGHFNPHGYVVRDGIQNVHPGDLGNILIGPDGSGFFELVVTGLSVSEGKYSVSGRSVIIHEREDDFGQPTGNAGGRIAGGSILVTGH